MATHTLLFGDLLVQIGCALGLALLSSRVTGFRGLRWFAWAYGCSTAALALGFLPPVLQAYHFAILGRLLLLLGAILLTQGIADFAVPGSTVLGFGRWLFLCYALVELATFFSPSRPVWIICMFGLAMTAQVLVGVFVLVTHEDPTEQTPCRAVAGALAVVAALFALRALLVFWGAASPATMASVWVRFGGIALHLAFSAVMAFGFVWLVAARLRSQLEGQASTDALTGVLNRRALNAAGERDLLHCRRRGLPLAVLAIDLDHFKDLNDSQGHAAGDAALSAAAQALAQGLRSGDRLARFGGEEFVAVLPERNAPTALAIAERLRLRVEALRISHEGQILTVTASFGVAVLHDPAADPADNWDMLLRRADRCLYEAKRAGRNCTRGPAAPVPLRIPAPGAAPFPLH